MRYERGNDEYILRDIRAGKKTYYKEEQAAQQDYVAYRGLQNRLFGS
jgi:hypothetical protein